MSRSRELDAAPPHLQPRRDRRWCCVKISTAGLTLSARSSRSAINRAKGIEFDDCGNAATYQIDGAFYCCRHAGARALEILTSEPEAEAIWIQWADSVLSDEKHIRKWDHKPFEGGLRFERKG